MSDVLADLLGEAMDRHLSLDGSADLKAMADYLHAAGVRVTDCNCDAPGPHRLTCPVSKRAGKRLDALNEQADNAGIGHAAGVRAAPPSDAAAPLDVDLDTLDRWQGAIKEVDLDIVRHFDRDHTKRDHEEMLRQVSGRLSKIASDLWTAGHRWDEQARRWEPPTRYMRDNAKALAALTPTADTPTGDEPYNTAGGHDDWDL